MKPTREELFKILSGVRDPEIPVLSIVDLGVIRDASYNEGVVEVTITPTYSGCPALKLMEDNIVLTLRDKGFPKATVKTVYSPAWTTDWLSDEAKSKLKEYGIAPPGKAPEDDLVLLTRKKKEVVPCPFCDSTKTELKSEFGSTACKALHFCNACRQPFEQFKAI